MTGRFDPLVFPDFQSREQALETLTILLEQFGVAYGTYLGIDIPALNVRTDYVTTTYPTDWAKHYFAQGYQAIDPAVTQGMRSILAYDWADSDRADPKIRRFFGEAREFGLGENGISIPIRGAAGERVLFSISSNLKGCDWRDFKTESLGNLTLAAYLFHQATLRLELGPGWSPPQLSPQEIEALRWASAGKSCWDTSIIMGISARTVEFYIKNAVAKLGAATKTQAVASAVRMGLL